MKYLMHIFLAGAALVPLAAAAKAADYAPSVPTEAATYSGLYLRADGGASFLAYSNAPNTTAFVFDGGIGYQFDQNFRADLTYNRTGDYTIAPGASLSTSTVLGTVYYDFKNDSALTPYIGAGVGYGWQYGTGTAFDSNGIAIGLNAGVAYEFTNNLALDVGYRFHDIFANNQNTPEHQVTAGLRVKF